MKTSKNIYEKRKGYYEILLKRQIHMSNFISALRLIIFITGSGFSIFFYLYRKYYFAESLLLITIIAFTVLVFKHNKVINNKKTTSYICEVNNMSISRLLGHWRSFKDNGDEFKSEEHNYSDDLDIFGKSSLFQWINTASTDLGRLKLRNLLAFPDLNIDNITKRQQAIKELSGSPGWRQRFEAEGMATSTEGQDINDLFLWARQRNKIIKNGFFKLILVFMPLITCSTVVYYFIKPSAGFYLPMIFIAINLTILKFFGNARSEALDTIYEYRKKIKAYHKLIRMIEKKKFKSRLLKELQKELISKDGLEASQSIKRFIKIVDRISDRRNFFSLVLNILFLWDFHLMIALDKWKGMHGKQIERWLNVIGEFEALSSLALINYDNPDWCFPRFNSNTLLLNARGIAHPLLPGKPVANDVLLDADRSILLITGSNMSGKSTLLRTLGICLVLAYAGAPVSAESFNCSMMNIYTCMRISDNLEKNISSFYAELLRIKKIVNAVTSGERIFFLLDEIFKGTNSIDRHIGAETLIDRLSRENALGLVSTHDLELGSMEDKNNKVKNYHFQEYYKDNDINFDYKLKPGVSTTRNAVYLMKMAGIKFEENQ